MKAPSILCPVDFSDASRGALRYGAALAEHFRAPLAVMTVTHPLLAEAAAMETSDAQCTADTLDALRRFFTESIDRSLTGASVTFETAVGKPEQEILRVARERGADLIVISSHGLTGFRKLFFGSTTERVLRETDVPVLIVPGDDRGPRSVAEAAPGVRRILAPVLLPPVSGGHLAVVRAIAETLAAPALLLHVVEPLRAVLPHSDRYLARVERERRLRAEVELEQLAADAGGAKPEALIAYGEPSEEIVKVARDRRVGLIVMGLQSSPEGGAHIGSVTYRVLCAAGRPVLALPARPAAGNFPQAGKKAARQQAAGNSK